MYKKIRIFTSIIAALIYVGLFIITKVYGNSDLLAFLMNFVVWICLLISINTSFAEQKNAGKTVAKKKLILVNLLMLVVLVLLVIFL